MGGYLLIYEYPSENEKIRQGDIFINLPRVEISLTQIPVLLENGEYREIAWKDVLDEGREVTALFGVKPVNAIVATQDCDTSHGKDITLFEIRKFQDVYPVVKETKKTSKWVDVITQHSRKNFKWFYLPPDDLIKFADRMAVDFSITIRLPRVELVKHCYLRKGRLNNVADEHFRERISEYYRRYPYDEWYPLSGDEFSAYQEKYSGAKPFSWQIEDTKPTS